jgi:hypothetical protein
MLPSPFQKAPFPQIAHFLKAALSDSGGTDLKGRTIETSSGNAAFKGHSCQGHNALEFCPAPFPEARPKFYLSLSRRDFLFSPALASYTI